MNTRTTTTVGLLLTGALALTACSSNSSDDKATSAPTTTAPAAPAPTTPVRDRFIYAVTTADIQSWRTNGPTDDEIAAYPDTWCGSLAQGHSVAWLFGQGGQYPIGMTWGTAKPDAYRVLVIAVGLYCPERKAAVEAELRASGDY